jgi:NAD(P)-dependent dehydrogenase (short-subunit alcohol dehydrogenase family)
MSETDEKDKVALVTGASSGIGQATAVELARRGYQVAVHYCSNEAGARETFEGIRALKQGQARVYSCDLSDSAQVVRMAGDVLADFGQLDALVNNAGSLVERRRLVEMDHDLWRRVMALNLDSVFLVTQAFLPHMIQHGTGTIVNVASIAGRNGGGLGASAYAAAKGAVITLSKSMAKELIASGIRVNCVNPGVIATPFHERFSTKEMIDRFITAIPQRRLGTSEEVARVIAFLVSDDSSHIVGECIEVNGGLLME